MSLRHFLLQAAVSLAASGSALAHGGAAPAMPVPKSLAPVQDEARKPAAAELKFGEMVRMPIGPHGLEPSDKLLALDGRRVRMIGYMAGAEAPMAGRIVLTPLPVSLGDEDESLSDDLPASAVFVHLGGAGSRYVVPNLKGLLQLTGTLRVGPQEEPDGHVSTVRLLLDDAESRRIVRATTPAGARAPQASERTQRRAQR